MSTTRITQSRNKREGRLYSFFMGAYRRDIFYSGRAVHSSANPLANRKARKQFRGIADETDFDIPF